jgi:hypothetical protein
MLVEEKNGNVDRMKNYEKTLIPTTDEEEKILLHAISYKHDRPSFLRNHDDNALNCQKQWMESLERLHEVAVAAQKGATTWEGQDIEGVFKKRHADLIALTKLYQEAYESEKGSGILGPAKVGFGFTIGDFLNWLSSLSSRTWTSLLFGALAGIATVILINLFP